jgi:hypothetical protein
MIWQCRVCGMQFPHSQRTPFLSHVVRCVECNSDVVDAFRPKRPFEGDPELLGFAMAEGSVYNRRPGTRRQPR